MDNMERAQELNIKMLEKINDQAKIKNTVVKPSREFCLDCGEPIPQGRREAVPGAERCTECETFASRVA